MTDGLIILTQDVLEHEVWLFLTSSDHQFMPHMCQAMTDGLIILTQAVLEHEVWLFLISSDTQFMPHMCQAMTDEKS